LTVAPISTCESFAVCPNKTITDFGNKNEIAINNIKPETLFKFFIEKENLCRQFIVDIYKCILDFIQVLNWGLRKIGRCYSSFVKNFSEVLNWGIP